MTHKHITLGTGFFAVDLRIRAEPLRCTTRCINAARYVYRVLCVISLGSLKKVLKASHAPLNASILLSYHAQWADAAQCAKSTHATKVTHPYAHAVAEHATNATKGISLGQIQTRVKYDSLMS